MRKVSVVAILVAGVLFLCGCSTTMKTKTQLGKVGESEYHLQVQAFEW